MEVEQIDFLRRIEGDIGPAGIRVGSRGTLMHANFIGGHIHGIKATGWVVGERNSHGSSAATAPTAPTPTTTAAGCKKSEDYRCHRSKAKPFVECLQCVHGCWSILL